MGFLLLGCISDYICESRKFGLIFTFFFQIFSGKELATDSLYRL